MIQNRSKHKNVFILGGGAAGFFAAIHHKSAFPDDTVTIIEKSKLLLSKVKISGGGRCNVTHACFEPNELVMNYPRGSKALLGPFHRFQPRDTMAWFESHGVPLKVELDGRVFPKSDRSQTIIDCLVTTAKSLGVSLWYPCQVTAITKSQTIFELTLDNGKKHHCDKLVLATGSNRKGYDWAIQFGHTIQKPVPSLFTFQVDDPHLHKLSGLSVLDVEVSLSNAKKRPFSGPLLITHWGVSGPSIIKCSAWHARTLFECGYHSIVTINWLPHHDNQALDNHFTTFQQKNPKKKVVSQSPFTEIPQRLWGYLISKSTLSIDIIWQSLTPNQRMTLKQILKETTFNISGKGIFKEEFVTCGGVSLNEINFKTMESKRCSGLHIVGELCDIDGFTGGFNFQNAWTTGYLASETIMK